MLKPSSLSAFTVSATSWRLVVIGILTSVPSTSTGTCWFPNVVSQSNGRCDDNLGSKLGGKPHDEHFGGFAFDHDDALAVVGQHCSVIEVRPSLKSDADVLTGLGSQPQPALRGVGPAHREVLNSSPDEAAVRHISEDLVDDEHHFLRPGAGCPVSIKRAASQPAASVLRSSPGENARTRA